jgi:hypothetical protein
VGNPNERCESGLEGLDLSAKDVEAALKNPSDSGIDCGSLREIAGVGIGLRNGIEELF